MHVIVVIQEIHESFSIGRNQTEPELLLRIAEVSAVGVEDLADLGVLALEDGHAVVYLPVVVHDYPLVDEVEAQALQHLLQQLRPPARSDLTADNVCMYVQYVCM